MAIELLLLLERRIDVSDPAGVTEALGLAPFCET
jgi:hypothetical protein